MRSAAAAWLRAVEQHLRSHERRFGATGFRTVYLGGGTPSWLPPDILGNALQLLGDSAGAGGTMPVEWTVEANPEDITNRFLEILADSGANRLSVGVQSLEDDARRTAGRRGSARDTMTRLETLSRDWSARWSADLMFGLPGQTPRGIERDAQWLSELGAGHLSLYELTLEPGTPLQTAAEAGTVRLPDEDERADMYEAAAEALVGAGYKRYEVSNWAKVGHECIHNEVYWDMGDWLAVGPSGVGNVSSGDGAFLRLENSSDDERYFSDPAGSVRGTVVFVTDAIFESLLTALRTAKGFNTSSFRKRFGLDAFVVFGKPHEQFPELLQYDGTSLRPTDRGLDLLNVALVAALANAERYRASVEHGNGAFL